MPTRKHKYPPIKKSIITREQPTKDMVRQELKDGPITWAYFEHAWLERLVIKGDDECWGWLGAFHRQGYSLFCVQKTGDSSKSGMMNAQRFAMALELGRPLRHDERVGSNCRNLECCNPKHLYITDYQHQCDHVKDIPFNGRPRKYTEPLFLEYYDAFSTLGPVALSKVIPGLTPATAACAKFAFNAWLKKMTS